MATITFPPISTMAATPRSYKIRKKPRRLPQLSEDIPDIRSKSEAIVRSPLKYNKYDIFEDHWLCESPRRIQFERTTLGIASPLQFHLDIFYDRAVSIRPDVVEDAKSEAKTFVEYLLKRMKKLGNKLGFKILDIVYAGSIFDDTCVVNANEIDLFVVFKKPPSAMHNMGPGYKYIPLRKYVKKEGCKPDAFRFGRSEDGHYLSPVVVAKNIYELVDRTLKLHSYAVLNELKLEDGRSQISVVLNNKYRVNITPAAFMQADNSYLVTRPYQYDDNPLSDAIWRVSHLPKERLIISRMDSADRCVRKQSFKLLKGLVKLEPTLEGINTYHLKTVLLNTFDDTVDNILRWQKDSVETCFHVLLKQLHYALSEKKLPNFFVKDQNLFLNMHPRICSRLYSRVTYMLVNEHELLRVLKKRSH